MVRLEKFSEAGITATTVGRMERAGEVVRLARGLYQLTDASLDAQQSLAEAAICALNASERTTRSLHRAVRCVAT